MREKLTRYCEIFNVKLQNELTHMWLLTTGKEMDETYFNNIAGLKVRDEASLILTDANCIEEFVARPTAVEQVFYKGRGTK